jgi:hypothetical protein
MATARYEGRPVVTLHQLDTPTRTRPPLVVVFGRPMTKDQALALSAELHHRGDYEGGLRALAEAGLTPHDLVEWSGQ